MVSRVVIRNSYGISTGNIYTRKSTNDPNKLVLQFMNTDKFYEIKKIRYSIYTAQGENLDNLPTSDFLTSQRTLNGETYYEYELPTRFTIQNTYYIQLQFYNVYDEVVSEETVVYNYIE